MEKWILRNPKTDFKKMSEALGISELLCRILVNRGIDDIESARRFIHTDLKYLHNPRKMKDIEKGAALLKDKIAEGQRIRIIGDYDVDGVISTYILYRALICCGAKVDYAIPHRILDGYGINSSIVERAHSDGIDTIITCDNGIAAAEQVRLAKELGLTVIITDHHEVPFQEDSAGNRIYVLPEADAVIDIKQQDCKYPFKLLCGAGVAFKLVQVLYEEMGIDPALADEFYPFVTIATVCDVVDLVGENRIFVKKGLAEINHSTHAGLTALMEQTGILGKEIGVYHLGFIIGPCINASGRLDCAMKGLELLLSADRHHAAALAKELNDLNTERKNMTLKAVDETVQEIENSSLKNDKVLVIYKPDVHESIAGIIAGRIREKYNAPAIVLTEGGHGAKGSGRSIDNYNMFEELMKCRRLLTKFGGHPMAAGLSLDSGNIGILREELNQITTLTSEDLIPKIYIDARVPIENIDIHTAADIYSLEPYGKGNSRPLFAEKDVLVSRCMVLGNEKKILKLRLAAKNRKTMDCIYFGDIEAFNLYISQKFGENDLQKIYAGQTSSVRIDVVFQIDINEYNGSRSVQLILQNYR